jgi:mRNA interferase HicA
MKGNEFIRKVRKLGRQRGVRVAFVAERGKWSHGTLYYGDKLRVDRNPKDEPKTGTLHAMLGQLGLTLTLDTQDGGFVVTFPDVPEAIAGRIRRNESIPAASPVGPEQYAIPLPAQTAAKAALYPGHPSSQHHKGRTG